MQKSRTPLTIGWEAAKANALPGFVLQGVMLSILIAYYTSARFANSLDRQIVPDKLAENMLFAHAPGNELRRLPPEIEDQHQFLRHDRQFRPDPLCNGLDRT